MYIISKMFVGLVPTDEQSIQMARPWVFSLDRLRTADFLGRQDYIDWWIKSWLKNKRPECVLKDLPLCVSESLHCDKKLYNMYLKKLSKNINDVQYVKSHYIIPDSATWNYIDFDVVDDEVFRYLNKTTSIPARLCPFIIGSRRLDILKSFVNEHGATKPLRDAVCCQWFDAVRWLLMEGAEIEDDCVGLAVRHARIFRELTMYNPPAKMSDWEDFLLQKILRRVPDIPLVEEWFWINGFREFSNSNHVS